MAIKKVIYLEVSREKHINWVRALKKLKVALPVNDFPGFWDKNIKTCPPSKLFLFTSLIQAYKILYTVNLKCVVHKRPAVTLFIHVTYLAFKHRSV